jgi:hypothetical protein
MAVDRGMVTQESLYLCQYSGARQSGSLRSAALAVCPTELTTDQMFSTIAAFRTFRLGRLGYKERSGQQRQGCPPVRKAKRLCRMRFASLKIFSASNG